MKTYGVPTISSLLVATKQLSTPEFASKRYVDTGVLIGEFTGHHPKSGRVIKALARMNYIHRYAHLLRLIIRALADCVGSGYQKSGKISQDDLLYTLSVFITEPISWVSKYEWRKMTDMESKSSSSWIIYPANSNKYVQLVRSGKVSVMLWGSSIRADSPRPNGLME